MAAFFHGPPARWLPGGHFQTIYPALVGRRRGALRFDRQRIDTPDGDFLDIDWLHPADGRARRLLTLFHGLEGGSGSHYAQALAGAATQAGYTVAVAHFRSCSGEPNRLARAYHSGDSEEIEFILKATAARHPDLPATAVGVSLGGNALLKALGEERALPVQAAVAVSAPMDLAAGGAALGRGFNRVYTRMFLSTLKLKALAKLERFPGLFEREALQRAASLYDFDNVYTAPVHGFRDTEDYWRRASSKPLLGGIRIPTLVVNALNDPFLPARFLARHHEVSRAVTLDYPAWGGHVGFMTGGFPGELAWLPGRILHYLEG
jgi:predicted alpha/beta-fold hydrolase